MLTLLSREMKLALRGGGSAGLALGFFLVVLLLLPLGIGPDQAVLSKVAPGGLWVAALLAALLSLDRLFQADAEDGTLDVLMTGNMPLELITTIKALAHWITTGLPLALISPVLAITLNLAPSAYGWLVLSLLIGTLGMSFLGAFGAALTVGIRRGGLLLSLLVLPLSIPLLVLALTLGILGLMPFATSYALRRALG